MARPQLKDAVGPLSVLTGGTGAPAVELLDLVYDELRALAGGYMRHQRASHTLQPTALVHEAYLRVVDRTGSSIESRAHFSALCAVAMRCVLADHARRRGAAKRGGGHEQVGLTGLDALEKESPIDAVALDAALTELAQRDERQARIVEYRYFGGMTVLEVAEVLGVSRSTVEDDWRMARAWLRVQLREPKDS